MMSMLSNSLLAVIVNWSDITETFNPTSTTNDDVITKSLDVMWRYALDGSMYKLTAGLGMFAAVVGVGFWSVKFYKALNESTLLPAVNEIIYPLLIVLLLANGGANIRNLTYGARGAINSINTSVYRVVDLDINYQTAFKVLARSNGDRYMMNYLYNACEANIDVAKHRTCLAGAQSFMNSRLTGRFSALNTSSTKAEMAAAVQEFDRYDQSVAIQKATEAQQRSNKGEVTTTVSDSVADPNKPQDIFKATRLPYASGKDYRSGFTENILAARKAFLYLLEVMMLVIGLVGPIFLGLSMFPIGTKPLIAWGTLFLSIGFCKICYTLIAGLSAVAMVLSGPTNVDMLIFSVVVGGLAPILAVTVASVLSNVLSSAAGQVGYQASNYGIDAKIAYSPAPVQQPNERV
jgi:hypothetical protein